MLTIFVKLFKALNSEQSANQLAIAISLAAIIGLTPLLSLHNLFIVLIALWFRVNLTLLIISVPLFSLIGFLLSPVFEPTGLVILQAPELVSFWDSFFNTIVGRWSNFYYAGVMGSFIISLITAIILFPISKIMITAYRNKWLVKIEKLKIVRMLKATKFWHLYSLHSNSQQS